MREVQAIRDFVGSPQNILGSPTTKHGEIAEQVNVGISRAREVLLGKIPTSTFEGVDRFAPIDYLREEVGVQAKYYNGLRNTLGGVSEHAAKYPGFAGGEGVYDIPRDQFSQYEQLHQTGGIDGMSDRSANSVRRSLDSLEGQTGRSADDLLRPGEAGYREVQQGRVHETIREHETELRQTNERLKDEARADHGPSLSGLGQAVGIGAGFGGGISLAQAIWVKCREGRNPFRGEFTLDDWKDVGMRSLEGSGRGGLAGGGVYLIANYARLPAPAAGSVVSGLIGIGSLLRRYHAGEIDADQFVDLSHMVAMDAAIVGLSSLAGQVLIPVPMAGAIIGSVAGQQVASAIRAALGEEEEELLAQLRAYEQDALARLDDTHRAYVRRLDAHFGSLERLADFAFDTKINLEIRLNTSVRFAQNIGVPDELILKTVDDLDDYMTE